MSDLRAHLKAEEYMGSVLKNLESEVGLGKASHVKINKVMLECNLVLFKHFLSSVCRAE